MINLFYPNLETVKTLAQEYPIIPVATEYYADTETPISVFKKLQTERHCFLLESVEKGNDRARYSFVGRNPFLIFKSCGDRVTLTDSDGKTTERTGHPMKILSEISQRYRSPVIEGIPSFSGGAVGQFGYDVARMFEKLDSPPPSDLNLPEMHFLFVDEIIAFDHKMQRLILIVNMRTDGDVEKNYERTQRRIVEIKQELDTQPANHISRAIRYRDKLEIKSNMTKEEYCKKVERAKEYIKNGDIFQVVFAQRFSIQTNVDPLNAYRAMRLINPSPYMYYLKFDDYQIAGASPEMLVRVQNGVVRTCPIAGTKPRGKTPAEDEANCKALLEDEKENAEHVMLVDLGRNDIGKVSEFGTVEVSRFQYLQKFSHVIHMTSDVQGRLAKDKTVFDALASALPAGTLSGAPKIRAMEIIDELETVRRGIYGGAIGYISFNGNFDSCITIRTALFKDGTAYVGAGGGIVYDSDPETEYQESVNKAAAVIKSIEEAGEIV